MAVGRVAGWLEDAFAAAWSVGEVGLAIARPHEVLRDPYRRALIDDVRARGFHPPIERHPELRISRRGVIHGPSPYARIGGGPRDRVLAHLRRAKRNPARHLIVVCHCYGIPSPPIMRRLFALHTIDADVVTNVMGHHQPGTYLLWPGSGLASARTSRFVENLRSAVTSVRAMVRWLRAHGEYETVSAIGFSIGGQLALHLAHAGEVDRALLYCPVASVGVTARELGLMRRMAPIFDPALERLHGGKMDELLALADPLAMALPIPEESLHVVVQRHDRLAPLHQIEPIRAKYPRVRWTELAGTHLVPLGLRELHAAVKSSLQIP